MKERGAKAAPVAPSPGDRIQRKQRGDLNASGPASRGRAAPTLKPSLRRQTKGGLPVSNNVPASTNQADSTLAGHADAIRGSHKRVAGDAKTAAIYDPIAT